MNFAVVTVAFASLVGAHVLDTGRSSFIDGVSYAGYAPSTASWARLAALGLAPKSALQYRNAAASKYATFAPEASAVLVDSAAAADASEPTYVLKAVRKAGLAYPESTANLNGVFYKAASFAPEASMTMGSAVAPETAYIVKAHPKSAATLNGLLYKTGSFAPEASMDMNSAIAPETTYIVKAHPKSAGLFEILPKTGSFYPESAAISKAASFAPESAIFANSAIAPETSYIVKAKNAQIVPESSYIVKAQNAQIVPESAYIVKAQNAPEYAVVLKAGRAHPKYFAAIPEDVYRAGAFAPQSAVYADAADAADARFAPLAAAPRAATPIYSTLADSADSGIAYSNL